MEDDCRLKGKEERKESTLEKAGGALDPRPQLFPKMSVAGW